MSGRILINPYNSDDEEQMTSDNLAKLEILDTGTVEELAEYITNSNGGFIAVNLARNRVQRHHTAIPVRLPRSTVV